MDPATILAITGACVGITRNAASFITGLNDLVVRLRDVELDLGAIEAQTSILGLVSERLRLWINIHQDELSEVERRRLWECIHSCDQLVRALETATNRAGRDPTIVGAAVERRKLGVWQRVQALVAQPQLQRYARALEQQGNALNTFLQVFQTTARLERPAALQNKRASTTIDDAISVASTTSAEVLTWLRNLEGNEGIIPDVPDEDLGFRDASSNTSSSSGSRTGSSRSSIHSIVRQGNPLNLQNLAIHNTWRRRQTINPRHTPHAQAAAPGAPGGGDSPPPSDSGMVFDSRTTPSLSGRSSGSSLPPSNGSRRAYVVRDELQRLSVASSSAFEGDQQAANPMVENVHSDLVRLQEIMLELRRAGQEGDGGQGPAANGIPPALERQIDQLFEQVRNNLRAIGNPDEQILRGSNINSRNALGETGLHIAARKRPVDVAAIRKFLNLGASPLVKDHNLNTPLLALFSTTYTSDQNFTDAFNLLLNAGSDINARANNGWTALSRVAEFMRFIELERLVTLGADVNQSTADLLTPLHRAAKYPSCSGVQFLLSRSANPNAISQSGETPLGVACQLSYTLGREQATIVELLLAAGASPTACRAGAKQPLDAVIMALKDQESSLKAHQLGVGDPGSFIWVRQNLEHSLCTINILLRHLSTITLHYTTRASVRSMYVFRPMPNIEAIPIVELRRHFRERIGQIVVLSNRELHDDVRRTV